MCIKVYKYFYMERNDISNQPVSSLYLHPPKNKMKKNNTFSYFMWPCFSYVFFTQIREKTLKKFASFSFWYFASKLIAIFLFLFLCGPFINLIYFVRHFCMWFCFLILFTFYFLAVILKNLLHSTFHINYVCMYTYSFNKKKAL